MSHQGSTVSLHSRFLCLLRFVYRNLNLDGLIRAMKSVVQVERDSLPRERRTDSVETTSERFEERQDLETLMEHISRGGGD
ncbi:unnamed protein product [Eruca vesicaria subsp. sativa]|uniref:Uncharacterized protein n=1 Tax=Eruca vesicaria subsp. sativa TaxID=29727 RepID=A0ABC8J6P4_ERUVS|nr:unnamed protein product [Eruca vesicaria subsp. sativa]